MKNKFIMGALALILTLCLLAVPASMSDEYDGPVLAWSESASSTSASSISVGDTGTANISISGSTVTISVSGSTSSWNYLWSVNWGDTTTSRSSDRIHTFSHTYAANGTYTISVYQEATVDGVEPDDFGEQSFTARIDSITSEAELSFTTPPSLDALSGSTFTYTPSVNVSNSTIVKQSGASWLTYSSSTGRLTGTAPTVSAETSYSVVLSATSPGGQTATQTVSIDVFPIAKLTASSTAVSADVGESISVTISSNINGSFSISSGSLPGGVALDSTTGVISGTPTTIGTYTATIRQSASEGPLQTPTIVISFAVTGVDFTITSTAPTTVVMTGSTYTYSPTASIAGVTYSISNAPSWLVVNNGVVVGSIPTTYTDETTETYTLTATKDGVTKSQICTISIEPTLTFTTIPTASMIVIPVFSYADDGTIVLGASDVVDSILSDEIKASPTMTYQFIFTGDSAQSLLWDFGDGSTSEDWSPIHTYAEAGVYIVTCTATNSLGSDICTYELTVEDPERTDYLTWILLGIVALLVLYMIFGRKKKGKRY